MDLEIDDDDLAALYTDPEYRNPAHGVDLTSRTRQRLGLLAQAVDQRDIRALKSLHLEKLRGQREGQWSIRVIGAWRLILRFQQEEGRHVVHVLELVDYH